VIPRDGKEAVGNNREKSGMEAAELTFAKIGGVSSTTITEPPSTPTANWVKASYDGSL